MPWDIRITAKIEPPPKTLADMPQDSALGSLESVRQCIEQILPGVEFHEEPSGKAKVERLESIGGKMPEAFLEILSKIPSTVQADYEGRDFHLQFYFNERDVVHGIDVEVRGSGDAIPTLSSIAQHTGWLFYERASGERLDFS